MPGSSSTAPQEDPKTEHTHVKERDSDFKVLLTVHFQLSEPLWTTSKILLQIVRTNELILFSMVK